MDIIDQARRLGAAIQQDETYIKMRTAEQRSEEDEALQELIEAYNTKRMMINIEASKTERDDEKLQALNKDMRHLYSAVMSNENMKEYNEAKRAFDEKFQRVIGILNNCSIGDDPETTEPFSTGSGCSGNCSSCGGC